jgi:hypothetical protein
MSDSPGWKGDQTVPPQYARIDAAYAYVELIIDGDNDGGDTPWRLLMRTAAAKNKSPQWVADKIREVAAGEQPECLSATAAAKMVEVRRQMTDPLFLTYVAGKMGAC